MVNLLLINTFPMEYRTVSQKVYPFPKGYTVDMSVNIIGLKTEKTGSHCW